MTDITELAQSLENAASKALIEEGLTWFCEEQLSHEDGIALHKADAEFIALANPTNILALVEALEKAQGMEAYWKTQCRGITDHGEELQARIAELESRTVKLSPELYTIGDLIRTQDNRITDQPMFVVFQKREIIGSDEHSPSRICWVWDGEEVSELRAKRLEALYQDGRDTRGYDRYAMQEVDEFVTACFTEHGCKDYLRQNGHNLRLPYIYACGSFRNNEYQLVRNWLAGIKVEAER
ncbi:TPA: ead/Ea22-like family protein [Klebsiella quasipneumoniae subsp. similipneumoniae]|nr:ead/Ea22-like family protein [Klebsiella quasipneumoniae subsp. similipneumoniae]